MVTYSATAGLLRVRNGCEIGDEVFEGNRAETLR